MPKINANISEKNLQHLEALRQMLGLVSRSQALEMIIDQFFKEKDAHKIKREE